MLNTVQEEDWTCMAWLEGFLGQCLFSLKRTWQHGLGLQSCIWKNHEISGTMSFGQIRAKYRCFVIAPSLQKSNSVYQHKHPQHGGGEVMIWGYSCCHRTWAPWADLLYRPKCFRLRCEAVCLRAKAWHSQENDPKHSSKSKSEWLEKKTNACKCKRTEATLYRRLSKNSSIMIRETEKAKHTNSSCCCLRWFHRLLNHTVCLAFPRTA